MISILPAIERHLSDACLGRPLGNRLADLLGGLDVASILPAPPTDFSVDDADTSVRPSPSSMIWA
jgi:hypothetical protein